MNKYRVSGLCTVICEMDVFANSKEEAIETANNEFGELTNYAGMGGTTHLVGVISSDDNRCVYPDTEPEFDDAEGIE